MNQINSCIFEGTMTELDCVPTGVSFILENSRISRVNGKNVKEITKIPVYATYNLVDNIETHKPIKEVVGTIIRVVGRMSSFETGGILRLLCIAEHIDLKP